MEKPKYVSFMVKMERTLLGLNTKNRTILKMLHLDASRT